MFGLFGGGRKPMFTPGILPEDDMQKRLAASHAGQGQGGAAMQMPKRSLGDKVGIFGGMLQDLDWTMGKGNADRARSYSDDNLKQARAEMERKQRIQAAMQLAGTDPRMMAMAQANPDAFVQQSMRNEMLSPLDVNADQRAQAALELQQSGQAFNQNLATDKFGYVQKRDAIGDERYNDETQYTRGQDERMWDYRGERDARQDYVTDRGFNRGAFESDRGFGLAQDQFGLAQNNSAFNQNLETEKLNRAKANPPMSPYEEARLKAMGGAQGKMEAEKQAMQPKALNAFNTMRADTESLVDKTTRAQNQSNRTNTGLIGQFSPTGLNLNATLQTIKADAGFGYLQEMRNNSPTGGALGQVSNQEIGLLQSARENVTRAQSEAQLDEALQNYAEVKQRGLLNVRQAYITDYGIDPVTGQKAIIEDGYIFNGGDPSDQNNWQKVQ